MSIVVQLKILALVSVIAAGVLVVTAAIHQSKVENTPTAAQKAKASAAIRTLYLR